MAASSPGSPPRSATRTWSTSRLVPHGRAGGGRAASRRPTPSTPSAATSRETLGPGHPRVERRVHPMPAVRLLAGDWDRAEAARRTSSTRSVSGSGTPTRSSSTASCCSASAWSRAGWTRSPTWCATRARARACPTGSTASGASPPARSATTTRRAGCSTGWPRTGSRTSRATSRGRACCGPPRCMAAHLGDTERAEELYDLFSSRARGGSCIPASTCSTRSPSTLGLLAAALGRHDDADAGTSPTPNSSRRRSPRRPARAHAAHGVRGGLRLDA